MYLWLLRFVRFSALFLEKMCLKQLLNYISSMYNNIKAMIKFIFVYEYYLFVRTFLLVR